MTVMMIETNMPFRFVADFPAAHSTNRSCSCASSVAFGGLTDQYRCDASSPHHVS
jgi:hypothetical protein